MLAHTCVCVCADKQFKAVITNMKLIFFVVTVSNINIFKIKIYANFFKCSYVKIQLWFGEAHMLSYLFLISSTVIFSNKVFLQRNGRKSIAVLRDFTVSVASNAD